MSIPTRDLRNRFPKVRELVESHGEVILTEKGKPRYRLTLASAVELEFKYFATFDVRQQQLARAAGLKVIVPSA